jgi:hypothetical protein
MKIENALEMKVKAATDYSSNRKPSSLQFLNFTSLKEVKPGHTEITIMKLIQQDDFIKVTRKL